MQPTAPLPGLAPPPAGPARLGHVREISYAKASQLLAPATGFISGYRFTLNPYSGCGFACEYCYARFFARTVEQQDAWGEWVRVKENALSLLRRAIRSKSERLALRPGDTIYMSSVTDPYQPIEKQLRLSRAILEALVEVQPRLTIQTRSPLIANDLDVLRQFDHLRVNMTIPTDSDTVRRRYEPFAPGIDIRFRTLERLREAAIPIGVSISPMLPVTDARAFGERLAALDAAEYVTQWMHSVRGRFSAGTPRGTVERLAEDGWTEAAYHDARASIIAALGPGRPLYEGTAGYQPPP